MRKRKLLLSIASVTGKMYIDKEAFEIMEDVEESLTAKDKFISHTEIGL